VTVWDKLTFLAALFNDASHGTLLLGAVTVAVVLAVSPFVAAWEYGRKQRRAERAEWDAMEVEQLSAIGAESLGLQELDPETFRRGTRRLVDDLFDVFGEDDQ
ncbi:hypothetical protein JYK22_21660, partial [Nonomuraea sp. RK-328]|nr:hypothetical protein [Nonomuraea sp. RK-328]